MPALLEMLRIPYTGSGVLTLALTLDKPMTKRVLAFHGLPTPAFQVFERADEPLDADMRFPLFVKPSREGTGMGVSGQSIVQNEAELREQLREQLGPLPPADPGRALHPRPRGDGGRDRQPGRAGGAARAGGRGGRAGVSRACASCRRWRSTSQAYPESEGGVYTNRMKTEWAHEFQYLCPAPLDADAGAAAQPADRRRVPRDRLPRRGARRLPPGRGRRRQAVHPGSQPAARPVSRA